MTQGGGSYSGGSSGNGGSQGGGTYTPSPGSQTTFEQPTYSSGGSFSGSGSGNSGFWSFLSNVTNLVGSLIYPSGTHYSSNPVVIVEQPTVVVKQTTGGNQYYTVNVQQSPTSQSNSQDLLSQILKFANQQTFGQSGNYPTSSAAQGYASATSSYGIPVALSAQSSPSTSAQGVTPHNPGQRLTVSTYPLGFPIDLISGWVTHLTGGWSNSQNSMLQAQFQLEQDKSNFAVAQAQVSALEQLQTAGLCNADCDASLAHFRSQVVQQQGNIDALQKAIDSGTPYTPGLVPQIAVSGGGGGGQIVAGNPNSVGSTQAGGSAPVAPIVTYAQGTGIPSDQIATNPSVSYPAPSVGGVEPTSAEGTSGPFPDIISRAAKALNSVLQPPPPGAAPTCTLLSSVLGGCQGW